MSTNKEDSYKGYKHTQLRIDRFLSPTQKKRLEAINNYSLALEKTQKDIQEKNQEINTLKHEVKHEAKTKTDKIQVIKKPRVIDTADTETKATTRAERLRAVLDSSIDSDDSDTEYTEPTRTTTASVARNKYLAISYTTLMHSDYVGVLWSLENLPYLYQNKVLIKVLDDLDDPMEDINQFAGQLYEEKLTANKIQSIIDEASKYYHQQSMLFYSIALTVFISAITIIAIITSITMSQSAIFTLLALAVVSAAIVLPITIVYASTLTPEKALSFLVGAKEKIVARETEQNEAENPCDNNIENDIESVPLDGSKDNHLITFGVFSRFNKNNYKLSRQPDIRAEIQAEIQANYTVKVGAGR